MLSDQCRHSMGRRKPFMLGGAVALSVSLLGFGFSSSLIHGLLRLLGLHSSETQIRRLVMFNALLWFCSLNIAIQPLQVGSRAFIIESCAVDDQALAHAWASRIQGLGSISGYFLASLPLSQVLFSGRLPQFATLCLLVSALLLITVFVSCFLIQESALQFHWNSTSREGNIGATCQRIIASAKRMPRPIRKICLIQSFAWMGWFPFLAYYTR